MPKSDLLRYFQDTDNGWSLFTLDPSTNQAVNCSKLTQRKLRFRQMKNTLFFKKRLSMQQVQKVDTNFSAGRRQSHYRNRYFIYQYQLETGLSQALTFGRNTASIRDISSDGNLILFSTTEEDLQRPFKKLYLSA